MSRPAGKKHANPPEHIAENIAILRILHDKQNRLVTLQNDAGMGNLTVPDWGQAAARNLWWEELRNYTSTGLIDGATAAAHFGEDWLFE